MALEKTRPLSYDDYAALPDDSKRYELIDGELFVMAAPSIWHQRLCGRIYTAFAVYLQEHPIGEVLVSPVDVILGEHKHQTYQPDVLFIGHERRRIIQAAYVQGAPNLVVEVLSTGTQNRDLGRKKRNYARYGVTEYWIVWQDVPRIEIYQWKAKGGYGDPRLLEAGDSLTTKLLPEFELAMDGLYSGLSGST